MSEALLHGNSAQIRISIYRCTGRELHRMTNASTDAQHITGAIRRMLKPSDEDSVFTLSLPPTRYAVDARGGPLTPDYPTSNFVSALSRGWPMEAVIGALNASANSQDKVARLMVVFSEGIGATETTPEDVGIQALDLGIPIYPVATNYENHIDEKWPRNLFRMRQFEALGAMTGGRSMEYSQIDAARLASILDGVKSDALSQYIVGFVPQAAEGKARSHKLEVKLVAKGAGKLEGGKRTAQY